MIENLLEKNKKSDVILTALVIFVILLIIGLVILRAIFSYTRVDGDSMMNTLTDRQFVIIRRTKTPYRGDIVIIDREKVTGDKEPLIKRVIATEGDKLLFMYDENSHFLNLYICVNGATRFSLCNEPYIAEKMLMDTYSYNFIPLKYTADITEIALDGDDERLKEIERCQITVPDGQFYFMGDNRNNSQDSRGKKYGTFNCTEILGKVVKIVDMSSFADKFLNFLSDISINTIEKGEQKL